MNIEIITTNDETLREIGFGTIKTCNDILDSINSIGYNVLLDEPQTKKDLNDIVKRKPDFVILAVQYIITPEDETIWLSEFFTEHGINFSGSLKDTMMSNDDKVFAKSYLKDKGISTPRYFTAVPGEHKRDYDIPINYPLFLKSIHSVNNNDKDELSLVNNYSEFESKVLSLHSLYNAPVLVEEYLDGQDFTVSIIKTQNGDMLVSAIEILAPEVEKSNIFLEREIKKENNKKLASIENKVLMNRVKNLAIDVYIDLEIRDFGQIEIRTNKSGHCYFMKTNLAPGMTNGTSHFPEACRIEHGLSYDEVIKFIVDEGISRA